MQLHSQALLTFGAPAHSTKQAQPHLQLKSPKTKLATDTPTTQLSDHKYVGVCNVEISMHVPIALITMPNQMTLK